MKNNCEKQFKEKDDVIQELKSCVELSTERELNAKNVKRNQSKLKFYTGFTNTELFDCCFDFVAKGQFTQHSQAALCLEDQFLLVLIRLRLGLSEKLLSFLFSVNISTVSRIFLPWIQARSWLSIPGGTAAHIATTWTKN